MRSTGAPRIAVLGLGNVLMGDDALGPYVARVLEAAYEFPNDVSVLDLGTPGLDLAPYVSNIEALVLVDTVKSAGEPGELRSYTKAEVLKHPPQPRLSPHDPGVKEALLMADLEGTGPREVLLVGVIPESTAMGTGLSPAVKRAVPRVVDAVLRELERQGIIVRPRAEPRPPDLWWEEGV